MFFARTALWIASTCFTSSALGNVVSGKVVAVREGDRIVVMDAKKRKHVIALLGVDAPQRGQAFFYSSLGALTKKVMNRRVKVEWWRYLGRCRAAKAECLKLGKVLLDDEDVNLSLVSRGLAWHDIRFLSEQSTPDRTIYRDREERAREKQLGLWKSKTPIPPWKFVQKSVVKRRK